MLKEMDKKCKKGNELSEKTMGKVNGGREEDDFDMVTIQLLCRNCGTVLDEVRIHRGKKCLVDIMKCKKCSWEDFPITKKIEE